ncbi:hypothetical protein ABMA08_14045 [Pseudomonas yamanorum]
MDAERPRRHSHAERGNDHHNGVSGNLVVGCAAAFAASLKFDGSHRGLGLLGGFVFFQRQATSPSLAALASMSWAGTLTQVAASTSPCFASQASTIW